MPEIVALSEGLFESLRQALDMVARERRYLALTEAPPAEQAYDFYRRVVAQKLVMSLATEGGAVVGWCDALPTYGQSRSHVAILGIGIVPAYRARGIGRKLLDKTLTNAWAAGFSRVELTVRVDNLSARALCNNCGFRAEGVLRQAFRVDGEYFDAVAMAALRQDGT